MTKVILVLSSIEEDYVNKIRETARDYEILTLDSLTDDRLPDIEIIYDWNSKVLEDKLPHMTSLKWVQVISSGVDYLPKEILRNSEIIVTNTSGIHAVGITESVFGFMLGLGRGVFPSIRAQMQKKWMEISNEDLSTLPGKRMLIFGTGKIGQEMARVAKAFGMKTKGVNSDGRPVENFDLTYTMEDVKDVLGTSHFVVNAMPLTNLTRDYFNEDFFEAMHDEGIFINIGRGPSVKEMDLYTALTDRKIRGAYLDVFEKEPLDADSPLWECPNLIMTPHITGKRADYHELALAIFLENLKSYVQKGHVVRNIYDANKGY